MGPVYADQPRIFIEIIGDIGQKSCQPSGNFIEAPDGLLYFDAIVSSWTDNVVLWSGFVEESNFSFSLQSDNLDPDFRYQCLIGFEPDGTFWWDNEGQRTIPNYQPIFAYIDIMASTTLIVNDAGEIKSAGGGQLLRNVRIKKVSPAGFSCDVVIPQPLVSYNLLADIERLKAQKQAQLDIDLIGDYSIRIIASLPLEIGSYRREINLGGLANLKYFFYGLIYWRLFFSSRRNK